MEAHAVARSVSRYVNDHILQTPSSSARVLAVFRSACDLVTVEEDVLAVVAPSIGDGPLNLVVDREELPFHTLEPGLPVLWDPHCLRLGRLEITLTDRSVWEPRPNWAALRARYPRAARHLSTLHRVCRRQRLPRGSLLALVDETSCLKLAAHANSVAIRRAIGVLRAGWNDDPASLLRGTRQLAGLGCGLTPSGDDFLVGLMLWSWLAHPDPACFCRRVVETAADRTTILSAAFLRAAARGECTPAWQALLVALAEGEEAGLKAAATGVLDRGATSGADALAGFLWAGSRALFRA